MTTKDKEVQAVQDALSVIVRWARLPFYLEIGERAGFQYDRSAIAILSMLGDGAEMRHSELAETLGIDRSTISRQVASVVKAGLVKGRPDATDKRATLLSLTEEGQRVRDRNGGAWRSIVEELLEPLTASERSQLAKLMPKLTTRLQASVPPR